MCVDKNDLIIALNNNVKEIQQCIDMHCCLMTSLLEGQADERNFKSIVDICPKHSKEIELKNSIKEAIDVLEESRKSFKSKRLEVLRKNLTQVLIDTY